MNNDQKKYLSVQELANVLNISRIAVFKKIKNGQIQAEKVGRNYIIPKDRLGGVIGEELTGELKNKIDNSIDRVIEEYGETLKMLAKE